MPCPLTSATDISQRLEGALVARNPRGMRFVREALPPAYLLRAAKQVIAAEGNIVICTGFPVAGTFETDGPPGAFALYHFLESLGRKPWLLSGDAIIRALGESIRTWPLTSFDYEGAHAEAQGLLLDLAPSLIIVIERPGAAADGRFYNIAGKDITEQCRPVEPLLELAACPVIAIGDGGNEAGMGRAGEVLDTLDIKPARISCDELIVADVSNWGAYGLIAMAETLCERPVLDWLDSEALLQRCVDLGAVDGVSHEPTNTEDGFDAAVGEALIEEIKLITSGGIKT